MNQKIQQEIFDPKSLTEEERFIKKLVDIVAGREFLDKLPRGQRRKLETKGRESRKIIKKQYAKIRVC